MVSTNTVCFEGICRIYRNSVVRNIREVLKSRYPDNWQAKIKAPFQREWERVQENAELRRQTGEVDTVLVDEVDLLGVNNFYNLFDVYFDDLFPQVQNMSENARRDTKQAV